MFRSAMHYQSGREQLLLKTLNNDVTNHLGNLANRQSLGGDISGINKRLSTLSTYRKKLIQPLNQDVE